MSLASETRTELDDLQMDSLKEVGIVGAEHATGALSKLIKNSIANDVTECHVEPLGTLPSSFGRPGDKIAVISIDVVSEKASRILMILPRDVAINYSDKLFGAESQPGRELNDNDKEALIEMGDMCIREYLVPISRFLNISFMPSAPSVEIDCIGDHMEFRQRLEELQSGYHVRVESTFIDSQKKFQGTIMFLPDNRTQELVFKQFGVDAEAQAVMFQKFGLENSKKMI